MAVVQMQRVSICALSKHRKKILESLQKQGYMEIDHGIDAEGEFSRQDVSNARSIMTKDVNQAEKAMEILEIYSPRPKVSFESLRGKAVLDKDIYEEGAAKKKEIEGVIAKINDLDRDIIALKANIAKQKNQMEELTPWMSLDVPMDFEGTDTVDFMVGTMEGVHTEREVEATLKEQAPDIDDYCIVTVHTSTDMTYFAVVVLKEQTQGLEDALRKIGFSRPSNLVNGVPSAVKEAMKGEIEDNEKEIATLADEIASFGDRWDDLRMFSDYCRIRGNKYELIGTIPQTKNAFAIEGYVPKSIATSLVSELSEKYDAIVEARDLEADETAPVLLKNNALGKIGEGTVESFGLPNKKEMDPSFIMTIFYVILFGLMLSDAAYGFVLTLATGILLVKFPRMGKGMKDLIKLFFLCGFSTMFWGIMFGGYFGDLIDVVAKTFFGVQLAEGQNIVPAAWFVPLADPMRMLVYSMLFGLIHMFVGLFLGGYQYLKNKDIVGFLVNTICVALFVGGLIMILLPTSIFQSIAQMEFNFPPIVGTISLVVTFVGLAGLILFAGRGTKNPVVRVALGLYEVYNNITGWLSDTLSYSRLLALGLATGVIGQVVNQMGSMFGGGVVGVIVFILVFLIGHVFNLAINLLGAYVHTCRLQYVEFFGKFYEGGGKKFEPFTAETKYVEIKGGQ